MPGLWTQKSPVSHPSARNSHGMAYDAARGEVVLFGGSAGGTETWTWDGTNWTQKSPANNPSSREQHMLVYDAARELVVFFGGQPSTFSEETWTWDGTDWTQESPGSSPSGRKVYHSCAWRETSQEIILHGGLTFVPSAFNDETWSWDGTDWTELFPGTTPSAQDASAMAPRTASELLLFIGNIGGIDSQETWLWDGSDWTLASPASAPSARTLFDMAAWCESDTVVLFGGQNDESFPVVDYLDDTWLWDGTNWTDLGLTGPSARFGHAMAFDEARNQIVLFGGGDGGGNKFDTWVLDCTFDGEASINHAFGLAE